MKKIIYLVLFSWFVSCNWKPAFCQTTKDSALYRITYSNGPPTKNPAQYKTGIECYDYLNNDFYVWQNNTWVKNNSYRPRGTDGKDAFVDVDDVQTITGAPGTNATVSVVDTDPQLNSASLLFQFTIPAGRDGISGGGAATGFISPDSYGAVHGNHPLTSSEVGQYADVGAVVGDQKDWAALQECYKYASGDYGIVLYGHYYTNRAIYLNKYDAYSVTYGNGAIFHVVGLAVFPVFACQAGTDENDAIIMQSDIVAMSNFDIYLTGNQTGFDFPNRSNLTLMNIRVFGENNQGTGFNLKFCMQGYLLNCMANNMYDGFIISWGGFPSATITSAQSNWTTLQTCHCLVSHIAFKVEQSYGVSLLDCLEQGQGTCLYAVYFDARGSGTVKEFNIDGFHFEKVNGATGAVFYLRMVNGPVKIARLNYQANVGSLLVDAASQTGGGLVILDRWAYLHNWTEKKWFRTDNNTGWIFNWSPVAWSQNDIQNAFDLTNGGVQACFTPGCGYRYARITE